MHSQKSGRRMARRADDRGEKDVLKNDREATKAEL